MSFSVVPDWPADLAWIHDTLASAGLAVSGPVEQTKVRPWSLVARVPVGDTSVWFKANHPCSAYEVRLVDAMGGWAPGRIPEPIGLEPDRGWLLLPRRRDDAARSGRRG